MLVAGLRALTAVLPHAQAAVRASITSLLWIVRRCATFGSRDLDADFSILPPPLPPPENDTPTDSESELSEAASFRQEARYTHKHTDGHMRLN